MHLFFRYRVLGDQSACIICAAIVLGLGLNRANLCHFSKCSCRKVVVSSWERNASCSADEQGKVVAANANAACCRALADTVDCDRHVPVPVDGVRACVRERKHTVAAVDLYPPLCILFVHPDGNRGGNAKHSVISGLFESHGDKGLADCLYSASKFSLILVG